MQPPLPETYTRQIDKAREYGDQASTLALAVTGFADEPWYADARAGQAVALAYLAQRATEKALGVRS